MMCYYLNVHLEGQRVNLSTFVRREVLPIGRKQIKPFRKQVAVSKRRQVNSLMPY